MSSSGGASDDARIKNARRGLAFPRMLLRAGMSPAPPMTNSRHTARPVPLPILAGYSRGQLSRSRRLRSCVLCAEAAEGLEVSEIAAGVFVHPQAECQNSATWPMRASWWRPIVAVIDTLGSAVAGRELRAAICAVTDKPIRYVINTHMHPDHVFGNAAFKQDNPTFVGHYKLARGLGSRAERYLAINKTMLGDAAFEGIEVICATLAEHDARSRRAQPRAGDATDRPYRQRSHHHRHEPTRCSSADLLFSVHVPTLDGSIKGWLALLDDLAQKKAARVVPGHGPHAMELPEALTPEQRYLATIAADVRKLIKDGKTLEDATKTAGFSSATPGSYLTTIMSASPRHRRTGRE